MSFLNLSFYAFIALFLMIYFITPYKYKYVVIAVGSYIFYGFTDIRMLSVLAVVTLITYIGGFVLEKRNKRWILALFFSLNIAILVAFKYLNFIIDNLNLLIVKINPSAQLIREIKILLPVGLSFIIFQSCTYLTDVYRGNMNVERNIVKYMAFVAFFPTILSGPIQKARELLPQISNPGKFNAEQAKKGTIVFVWGLFEKIMVADKLFVIVSRVFDDFLNFNSAYYIVSAICFSLYIYADFSAYSDMARGISMILGIQIGKNFNNPYLSCTTSEFWNRWHISLNSWFIENVYIPLGGNRKGKLRKYINVFIVFVISGLWHGADYHFVVWGAVNGLLVIIGQILKPIKSRIYQNLKVDENLESIRFCKRMVVFWLITLTWVFFNNNIMDALYLVRQIVFFHPLNFFDENLLSISGTTVATFMTAVTTIIFGIVQVRRRNEAEEYAKFSRQPFLFQISLVAIMICACVFAACFTDTGVSTKFVYFQF